MIVPKSALLAFLLTSNLVAAQNLDFASADALDISELPADRVKPAKTGPKPEPEPEAIQCGCGEEEFIIDFSQFSQGEYVTEVSQNNLNVMAIGSQGGEAHTPSLDDLRTHVPSGGAARIFDTSDPKPDFDLGSPNSMCPTPGPGLGEAGQPGMPGENCVPQGNVMIVQRREKLRPDDAEGGGSLVFTLDPSTKWRLLSFGILDIMEDVQVNVFTKKRYNNEDDMNFFNGFGPNSYQEVVLDIPIRWHSEIRIELPSDGGLSWLKFCQPERKPTPPGATAQRRRLQRLE